MNKEVMRALGLDEWVEKVEQGKCPMCGETIQELEFRTQRSFKEFGISGACQKCQDEFFEEE